MLLKWIRWKRKTQLKVYHLLEQKKSDLRSIKKSIRLVQRQIRHLERDNVKATAEVRRHVTHSRKIEALLLCKSIALNKQQINRFTITEAQLKANLLKIQSFYSNISMASSIQLAANTAGISSEKINVKDITSAYREFDKANCKMDYNNQLIQDAFSQPSEVDDREVENVMNEIINSNDIPKIELIQNPVISSPPIQQSVQKQEEPPTECIPG